ncbi:MAG TPA: hypothetical protein VF017_10975 [Thermoanaerobaculia bacterium]|nr:hypothetical protein [Thermoanaerobaculia bacterium]
MPRLRSLLASRAVLIGTCFWLVPVGAGAAEADFSAISEVQDVNPTVLPYLFVVAGPAGAVHHEISIPESCPKTPPMVNGDGDGDTAMDDRQLDLNGAGTGMAQEAPNGSLQLWCIDPDPGPPVRGYYALLWDPAGNAAGPRFVGKCPFKRGWNSGWKFINPRTLHVQQVKWESTDHNPDDDGDGKLDKWTYLYDTGADTVEQEHREDGAVQPDGAGATAPSALPFDFPKLLPKNPANDNPTVGGGTGTGGMDGDMPRLLEGVIATLSLRTVVANDGPMSPSNASVTITVDAPSGCLVDEAATSTRTHSLSVATATLEERLDSFSILCSSPGVRVFTMTTHVLPDQGGVTDPVPEDDVSIATLTLGIVASSEIPTLSGWLLGAFGLLLLGVGWGLLRRRRCSGATHRG